MSTQQLTNFKFRLKGKCRLEVEVSLDFSDVFEEKFVIPLIKFHSIEMHPLHQLLSGVFEMENKKFTTPNS
jgi:hypothetical protein